MSNPKAKSPYQRKQKKPHVYSELSERQLEVWQYLVTSGYAWTLPGRYGRMAQALIDNGEIEDPREFGLRASA